jgi:hypothetical protein
MRKAQARRHLVTARLESNDPTQTSLKLFKDPGEHFEDFGNFLSALRYNTVVSSVEVSWRFLRALTEVDRCFLMKQLGLLPSIEAFLIDGIGPSSALVVALDGARQTLKKLRVGFVRVNGDEDIAELATAFGMLQALEGVSLSTVRLRVQGQYMLDAQGMVTFQEVHQSYLVSIDPLLNALASLPFLGTIQLQLRLDATKFSRIENETVQKLCHNRRSLFLHACNLDDDHCLAMARQLQLIDTKLKCLVLDQNPSIGKRGWSALEKMLEGNHCLDNLLTERHQYDGNTAAPVRGKEVASTGLMTAAVHSQECWAQMEYYLKLNRAGRALLFGDDENFYRDSVDFMIQGKDDSDTVFYALRTNPSLCVSPMREHHFR